MEALKQAERKVVGSKAVLRALKARTAARVYVASDIDTFLYQKLIRACEDAGVPVTKVASAGELGRCCELEIGSAAAAVLR